MWRRLIILPTVILLIFLNIVTESDFSLLFLMAPFLFLLAFYFSIIGDRLSTCVTVGLLLLWTIYAASRSQNSIHLLLILSFVLVALAVSLYEWHWAHRIREAEERKQRTCNETKVLQEKTSARLDSLKHLESRVNGLIQLFEIARDFNECLNFSEILSVLDQKITPQLSFARGAIILPSGAGGSIHCLSFGPQSRGDKDLSARFAEVCLKMVTVLDQTVKLEAPMDEEQNQFASFDTLFPLWLFPLSMERQLIAVLAVEGGDQNDFQKFEVLASQLTLQVKKVRLYETVRETSIVDGLTNVFLRRHFLERFREELKRAVRYQFPLSVLMVDVDHFKSYNDKFGHLVGDQTLREVAKIIRENVRRVDVIGRYGGEEFIIVAPEIGKAQGLELAERIRSAVAKKRLHLYDEETQITVSIGVSAFPDSLGRQPIKEFQEEHLTTLIQKTDEAMYRAKEEGRNRAVTYD